MILLYALILASTLLVVSLFFCCVSSNFPH